MEYILITGLVILSLIGLILYVRKLEKDNIQAKAETLNVKKILQQKNSVQYDLNKLSRLRDKLFKATSTNGNSISKTRSNRNIKKTSN